jgi:N-acetylglucosaminyldiphosphoundecaprenol N-acetyl-beta-D-mannosaminyltransferase
MNDVLDRVDKAIDTKSSMDIGVVNAAKIVNMERDSELSEAVLSSDEIYADGMSVVWASRMLGTPLPERIAGIDLMHGILQRGQAHGYRVFCLGATQGVLDAVCGRFADSYPGTVIVGAHSGYFEPEEEEKIALSIRDATADVLFVAITSPKKEQFMARWSAVMNVPVVHGVGGSFDVVAGVVKRAPESWQRAGLEWLYRVCQEPGRLWKRYFVTNTTFVKIVVFTKIKQLIQRLS